MKQLMLTVLVLLLLCCGGAMADWTCPEPSCGRTWGDQELFCKRCGWEAPVHGLYVSMQGLDFLEIRRYGYMQDGVSVFYRTAGSSAWEGVELTTRSRVLLKGLTPGATYEILLQDWNDNTMTLMASTGTAATPSPTPRPTAAFSLAGTWTISSVYDGTSETTAFNGQITWILCEDGTSVEFGVYSDELSYSTWQKTASGCQLTYENGSTQIFTLESDHRLSITIDTLDYVLYLTRTSTSTAIPTATPRPTATPTPRPTATPTPKPTPKPTARPTATPTPKPVASYVWVGEKVTFGSYPQGSSGSYSMPLEWQVLDVQGSKALLITSKSIDCRTFSSGGDTTWETSSMRTWLNGSFLSRAFSSREQSAILTTCVDNSSGQSYWGLWGGSNTYDKVYLLSYAEANRYLNLRHFSASGATSNKTARASYTDYAKAQGAKGYSKYTTQDNKPAAYWWLRSPGKTYSQVSYVGADGSMGTNVGTSTFCVRPVIWVDLNTGIL